MILQFLNNPRVVFAWNTWSQDLGVFVLGSLLTVLVMLAVVWPYWWRRHGDRATSGEIARLNSILMARDKEIERLKPAEDELVDLRKVLVSLSIGRKR